MANTESTVGETSAVGCYSTGLSPYGCEDLSGNVWEWTRSLWGKSYSKPEFGYPYDPDDAKREYLETEGKVLRILRGGSWDDLRVDARCAFRVWHHPVFRSVYGGFRVVLRSAPVS